MYAHNLIPWVAALLCMSATANLYAHEGSHHHGSDDPHTLRTWTIAEDDTGSHLHGSFVSAKDGQLQIRKDDGKLIIIAVNRLNAADQAWVKNRIHEIEVLNRQPLVGTVMLRQPMQVKTVGAEKKISMPAIGEHFMPFEKLLKLDWDENYLYVGSNGLPEHPIMIGITSWQQQVPIPQKYLGDNAWQIPLHPVPAKNPMLTKNDFLRGAIALAVNGVPIFNPLNNRGDDAFLFGELDEYGGHCGRGDDYHYHIAPVHLEEKIGEGNPIGYALDGYPIFSYQEENDPDFAALDNLGGHKDAAGNYHYHAQKTYPYLNGGFYGEVSKRGGQVDPQPRAEPVRPDLRPLQGAIITGFRKTGNRFKLQYEVSGEKGAVTYFIKDDGKIDFTFREIDGQTRSVSYSSSMGKPYLPQADTPDSDGGTVLNPANEPPELIVTSSALKAGDELPVEFTGDGDGQSPPISWTAGPPGTESYAVNLWHVPDHGDTKSYWLIYDIPADVTKLPQNVSGVGKMGYNEKGRREYDPMRSKGPGVKRYQITVFALSEKPEFTTEKVTREDLLQSISEITLAKGTLDFQYTRFQSASWWLMIGLLMAAVVAVVGWFKLKKANT